MSIVFEIKNKNDLTKNYSKCNVLIDDNLTTLKERLFGIIEVGQTATGESEPDFDLYPNLLKIEIVINDETGETIVVKDAVNPLLNNYPDDYIPNQPIVYFTTLKDELEKHDVMDMFINMGKEKYENLYNDLKKDFIDLTKVDMDMILYYSVFLKSQNQFIDQSKLDAIQYYVNTTLRTKYRNTRAKVIKNKYNETVSSYPISQFKNYFSTTAEEYDEQNDIYYMSVSLNIVGNNVESGMRGKFIKLRNIFNTIELNEDLPFVSIGLEGGRDDEQKNPLIKVYDKLNKLVTEREFRSWILMEKKKEGKVSYKKVKGLHIRIPVIFDEEGKSEFLFISLQDNGIINAKILFAEDDNVQELDSIITIILNKIDNVIKYISELGGIFLRDKRLLLTNESKVTIDDINCFVKIPMAINRSNLISMLNRNDIKQSVFELKDIKSVQFLSMYYKKYTSKLEGEIEESERRGITINLKDDPYKEKSSIIVIYGADSVLQILTLIKQLIIINETSKKVQQTSLFTKREEQKVIKTKSHIKMLKKQGVKISSKKCPQFKLPNVDDNSMPLVGSYVLEVNNKKYTCQNPEYKFPGFTISNDICCFKKDQRGKANYIRNIGDEIQITLHPSNFKLNLTIEDGNETIEIDTYVLKASNEYLEMKKRDPKIPLYYWINEGVLVPILDKTTIKYITNVDIKTDGKIWLEEAMPLSILIGDTGVSNCKYMPDFKKDTKLDIDKKCEHHETNKFFGYNLNSYPCCFYNERDLIINRQRKRAKTKHIFNTDKLLEHERIGVLQSYLNKLFNEFGDVKTKKPDYYRMGVTQNNSAFFNAILMAIEDDEKLNIKSSTQFRGYLLDYLKKNENEYKKLNNGLVALKYGNVSNYIEWLEDYTNYINWNDTLDLVKMSIGYNIMILEVPFKYLDSTKIPDYDNIRLKCQNYHMLGEKKNGYDINKPFIILIKKEKTYELIIKIKKGDKEDDIIKSFKYEENDIIKFLYEYYLNTCIKDSNYPENYKYDELESSIEIIDKLKNTEHEAMYEIINSYNKVIYILTKRGVLVPVKQSGIIMKSIRLSDLIEKSKLLDIEKLQTRVNEINKILDKEYIKINGVTSDYRAVLTNLGQLIPILKINDKESREKYKKSDYPYYEDVDEYIIGEKTYINRANEYINMSKKMKDKIYGVKVVLAKVFSQKEDLKKYIESINKLVTSRNVKINLMFKKFKEIYESIKDRVNLFKTIEENELIFIFKLIANEIIDDNRDNLLLNNLIVSDVFDPKEIVKRENETLLTDIGDIQKWSRIQDE